MSVKILDNNLFFEEILKLLDSGITPIIKAKGNSMIPFIFNGNSIELQRVEEYNVDDIVLAHINNSTYVVHRIIAIDGENATLKGDGNVYGVERCRVADIKAKTLTVHRKDKVIDLYSKRNIQLLKLWKFLSPIRRYLLWIIRKVQF